MWWRRSGCCGLSSGPKVSWPSAQGVLGGDWKDACGCRAPSTAWGSPWPSAAHMPTHALPPAGLHRSRRTPLAVGFDAGATDDAECAICHLYMHLSAVECDCCAGRRACLHHAANLCGCAMGQRRLVFRHTLRELEAMHAGGCGGWDEGQGLGGAPGMRAAWRSRWCAFWPGEPQPNARKQTAPALPCLPTNLQPWQRLCLPASRLSWMGWRRQPPPAPLAPPPPARPPPHAWRLSGSSARSKGFRQLRQQPRPQQLSRPQRQQQLQRRQRRRRMRQS